VALIFTLVSTVVQPLFLPTSDANFIVPILSVACNRLILSLRGLYFAAGTPDEDTLTTFAAEHCVTRRTLGLDSQMSAFVNMERSGSRIGDEGTVAEAPMRTACEAMTQTGST